MAQRLKYVRIWPLLIAILCSLLPVRSQNKEIIGYYPSWKWKSRNNLVTPETLPYEKFTIINYAFFYPLPDGRLVGRDSVGDDKNLRGERDSESEGYKPGTALVELAHRHDVKVLLSVGGWEDSGNFPIVASGEATRRQFAHSCVELIQEFGFDGIDIDWEYPCYVDHKGTPADRSNFMILLKTTRDSLNANERGLGKKLLLTAALPAGASLAKNFEMEKIADVLDMLNAMTYDFSGPWDGVSGHNSPLYSTPGRNDSTGSIDAAFRMFTMRYGISARKINIGIPFYGHAFAQCDSIGGSHAGADTVCFSSQGCSYYDIVQVLHRFTRIWDGRARVPYLVNAAQRTLVSYDDVESIGYKAQYVLDHQGGGVIIWEVTGDYLPDRRTPLLDVIVSKFRGAR